CLAPPRPPPLGRCGRRPDRRRWVWVVCSGSWPALLEGGGVSHQTPASSCSGSVAVLACEHARRYASAEASVTSGETAWAENVRPPDSTTTRTSPSASAPPETA